MRHFEFSKYENCKKTTASVTAAETDTSNKQLNNSGAKEATKAFSYYGKNTRSYYRGFIRGIPMNVVLNGSESFLKSDLMKRNYSHLFGG